MAKKKEGGFGAMNTPWGGMGGYGGKRPFNLGAPRPGLDTMPKSNGAVYGGPGMGTPAHTLPQTGGQAMPMGQPAMTPTAPAFDMSATGGAFSQNEGIGAGMTPQQISAYGDPEARPVSPYASPMDPNRQLQRGVPQNDPWSFMYGQPQQDTQAQQQGLLAQIQAMQQQQTPQLTAADVFANSQRAGQAGGGLQYDAAGNLVSKITPWIGY
jgi:hypothetical protein